MAPYRPRKRWGKERKLVQGTVLARDNYQCRICGEHTKGTHHCIPFIADPLRRPWRELDQPWNMITACPDCHHEIHQDISLFAEWWHWAETNYKRLKAAEA